MRRNLLHIAIAALAILAITTTPGFAQSGKSGATLQASKTVEICDNGDGTWTYSGAVSVWNTGSNDAAGCQIVDVIETKDASGPNWTTACTALLNASCGDLGAIVPGGTLEDSAFVTTYSCSAPAAATTVRNNAQVTISNHSGGRTNGPNPKATYFGPVPPEACGGACGCSLTQGYWKNHADDPAWSTADLGVFDVFSDADLDLVDDDGGSGADEALAILQTPPQGNQWYILAHQYIAYVLNQAHGSCTPQGLVPTVQNVANFFANHTDAQACAPITGKGGDKNPCDVPLDTACILDVYNHGEYPEGPVHCEEADPSGKICAGLPTL